MGGGVSIVGGVGAASIGTNWIGGNTHGGGIKGIGVRWSGGVDGGGGGAGRSG